MMRVFISSPFYLKDYLISLSMLGLFVSAVDDVQGCGCRLLSGGVGMPRLGTETFVQRCDVGELQQHDLTG